MLQSYAKVPEINVQLQTCTYFSFMITWYNNPQLMKINLLLTRTLVLLFTPPHLDIQMAHTLLLAYCANGSEFWDYESANNTGDSIDNCLQQCLTHILRDHRGEGGDNSHDSTRLDCSVLWIIFCWFWVRIMRSVLNKQTLFPPDTNISQAN